MTLSGTPLKRPSSDAGRSGQPWAWGCDRPRAGSGQQEAVPWEAGRNLLSELGFFFFFNVELGSSLM